MFSHQANLMGFIHQLVAKKDNFMLIRENITNGIMFTLPFVVTGSNVYQGQVFFPLLILATNLRIGF